jgi:hypothetical protein
MDLKEQFRIKPHVSDKILTEHFDDFKKIENAINEALKEYPNFVGIDFCDVSAGGIQIRGHHKDVQRYCYGDQVTIKYDFSNIDEAITAFVQMWRRKDTPEQAQDYKDFLADGERHGWD